MLSPQIKKTKKNKNKKQGRRAQRMGITSSIQTAMMAAQDRAAENMKKMQLEQRDNMMKGKKEMMFKRAKIEQSLARARARENTKWIGKCRMNDRKSVEKRKKGEVGNCTFAFAFLLPSLQLFLVLLKFPCALLSLPRILLSPPLSQRFRPFSLTHWCSCFSS
jgi:uncharacterized Fe-S radical SAM superfamily protein PflX